MGRKKASDQTQSLPIQPDAADGPDLDPAWIERIQKKLVDWYVSAHRKLPWRETRDPYRVLVSEMMLVQTTVTAVVPFFERFLARFPTIESLATADEADVLKAWEGLGYYRRARQLQGAARAVIDLHEGRFPDDPEAVRALPGVGRYIAGAILSFAFDKPAPIVEANTQRVLSRWLAWSEDLKTTRSQVRLWRAAERLVPASGAGTFNQAFMELGALVCTPRNPMCLVCPVSTECMARAQGIQDRLPVMPPKAAPLAVLEESAIVVRDEKILIVQRQPGGLWANFWEFPTIHISGADPGGRILESEVNLARGVEILTGAKVTVGTKVQSLSYGVTKHKVQLDAYSARGLSESLKPGPKLMDARWVRPEELVEYPLGSAGRKLRVWIAKNWEALLRACPNS
ncbi:A/G-specific adenine glycosylase [Singulisphaera sp. PoT]|uniref:A/G-specific adenine glycosylase n=1 Tax=Singulisphaera sp. PoT TaxID=3411797 RepID=UPI003BF5D24D